MTYVHDNHSSSTHTPCPTSTHAHVHTRNHTITLHTNTGIGNHPRELLMSHECTRSLHSLSPPPLARVPCPRPGSSGRVSHTAAAVSLGASRWHSRRGLERASSEGGSGGWSVLALPLSLVSLPSAEFSSFIYVLGLTAFDFCLLCI